MTYQKLFKAAAILMIIVLIVVILVYAKPFLVPLTFGAIFSMLLLPIVKWLQSKGINKALSTIAAILVFLSFFAIIIFFVRWQLSDVSISSAKMEQQVSTRFQQAQKYIAEHLGIPQPKQQQMIKEQQKSSPSKLGTMITGLLAGVGGFLTNTILVLVYIFLFIYFRDRLKGFVVKMVPKHEEKNAIVTINTAQKVAQKYLTGLFFMIICLWIMYTIGFSIAGVKSPFFFAIICGLLEIVPFIGNLLGTGITIAMSIAQGAGSNVVIAILITYGLVQFIQTYILEPLVVGAEVNINPLFTIIGLVAGETLWGIPGMVLAIPLMGIAKIVCDHVEPLKPYAYLIGQEKKENTMKEKIKGWFGKKKG